MDITLNQICKRYDGKTVIDHFSYCFKDGSRTCIMGESGVGKTTILNILMGLAESDSGTLTKDENIRCSAVFQEYRLCDNLTPVTNIRMVLEKNKTLPKEVSSVREFVMNELKEVLEEEVLDKKAGCLSGGQKQRVAVVRALCADSDLVLMDEPFQGLDYETKLKTAAYVKNRLGGRTLIVVTHDEKDKCILGADICLLTKALQVVKM